MIRACRGALIALSIVVVASCSSDDDDGAPRFDATRYDRTCATASDCTVVYSGDPCGCACEQVAVALAEQSRITEDRTAHIAAHCPEGPPDCGACAPSPKAECRASVCELVP
jgi:hypothetical protein